jgi:hypothetical protein
VVFLHIGISYFSPIRIDWRLHSSLMSLITELLDVPHQVQSLYIRCGTMVLQIPLVSINRVPVMLPRILIALAIFPSFCEVLSDNVVITPLTLERFCRKRKYLKGLSKKRLIVSPMCVIQIIRAMRLLTHGRGKISLDTSLVYRTYREIVFALMRVLLRPS